MQMDHTLSLILCKAENAKLIEYFCEANVEFLIVGGAAMAAYGCRDAVDVDDLDLLVSPTLENAQKIFSALSAAQIRLSAEPQSLAKFAVQMPIKNWQYWAELITPLEGFKFEEMLEAAVAIKFRSGTLYIVSLSDLRKMKEAVIADTQRLLAKHQRDLECLRNI